jgi:hypothetical protein
MDNETYARIRILVWPKKVVGRDVQYKETSALQPHYQGLQQKRISYFYK